MGFIYAEIVMKNANIKLIEIGQIISENDTFD